MTDPRQPTPNRKAAAFLAAVRKRGVLNAMLDEPIKRFETGNPGWKARWEYWPPGGDNQFVVAREALGFRLVDASEIEGLTTSEQKTGVIRRGDLVLMAGPEEMVAMIAEQDADMAKEDSRLPEETYRKHIESIRTRSPSTGEVVGPVPVGHIKRTTETVGVPEPEHEVETE